MAGGTTVHDAPGGRGTGVGLTGRLAARAATLALAVTLLVAGPAVALSVWSVTATPLTLSTNTPTAIRLTVTQVLLNGIGCVVVSVPAGFTVQGSAIVSAPSGWVARTAKPGPPTLLQFDSGNGGHLLSGASAVLSITATATTTGLAAWTITSYQTVSDSGPGTNNCQGSNGTPTVPLAAFVILPGPTPTPSPTPTPTPTPTSPPTPSPTATPTPSLTPSTGPTPTPSFRPSGEPSPGTSGTPGPSGAPPSSSPSPSVGPGASAGATASVGPSAATSSPTDPPLGIGPVTSLPTTGQGGGGRTFTIPVGGGGSVDVGFDGGLGDLLGPFVVPSFLAAATGSLVVLLMLSQALGGMVWLPVVRRRIGAFGLRRKRSTQAAGGA